jgi:hypothetical protein
LAACPKQAHIDRGKRPLDRLIRSGGFLFCAVRADDVPGSPAIVENHRRLAASDRRPCEDLRPMLLAPGAAWNDGLAAEKFHMLSDSAQRQRQLFVRRSQSRSFLVFVHHNDFPWKAILDAAAEGTRIRSARMFGIA